jgi:hypothetical protein
MAGFCKCIILRALEEINQVITNFKVSLHSALKCDAGD